MQRRDVLKTLLSLLVLMPINALAALWNKPAFEAVKLDDARAQLQIANEIESTHIYITAPDRAENGAIVQIEVRSEIANTEAIAIFAEHNPTALIANFMFSNGAEPYVVTRIKMAESSDVKVVVKAGSQYFSNQKYVEVLENGCG
jgi:sulfur-oxidizing protein SoxY